MLKDVLRYVVIWKHSRTLLSDPETLWGLLCNPIDIVGNKGCKTQLLIVTYVPRVTRRLFWSFMSVLFFMLFIFSMLLINHNSIHSLDRAWLVFQCCYGDYDHISYLNRRLNKLKLCLLFFLPKWDPLLWKLKTCTCILQECGMSCCLLNTQDL